MTRVEPIRFEQGRPMQLGGLRRRHAFAESSRTIPQQWHEFESTLPLPGQLGTTTYGVVCGADNSGLEYMCAVEVESLSVLPADVGRMQLRAQRYAVFLHSGDVSDIQATWRRILDQWLPQSGYRSAQRPDFEVYDHRFDPRTGKGEVEIWIAIADDERGGHS
ncbi:MAG TPA: GyrI-like domain-containing protein [Casimicrobiaceae bacterium]|jgi:predicted transcriptional regulator YdeE